MDIRMTLPQDGNHTNAMDLLFNTTSSPFNPVTSQSINQSHPTLSAELTRVRDVSSDVVSRLLSTGVLTSQPGHGPSPPVPVSHSLAPGVFRFDGRDGIVWRLANTGEMGGALILLGLGAVITFVVVMGLMSCIRRRRHKYQKVPTTERPDFDYIYRPLQGGRLDEEYENTFVGVSIPLLQDNTKV